MALTQTEVSQLYVAIFNRASEGEGNTFWQTFYVESEIEESMGEVADAMLATTDAKDYFGDSIDSNQDFIEHIYLNTLNKTIADDPDGIAYWVGRLDAGDNRGDVVADLVFAATTEENAGDAQDQFNNRVEVSNYSAETCDKVPANYKEALGFRTVNEPNNDLVVTEDPDTIGPAEALVDRCSHIVADNLFTLMEVPDVEATTEQALYWENIRADDFLDFLIKVAGIDVAQLGLIDDEGNSNIDNVVNITAGDIGNTGGDGGNAGDGAIPGGTGGDADGGNAGRITFRLNDGSLVTTEVDLGIAYLQAMGAIIFDDDGSRLSYRDEVIEEEVPGGAIKLTPSLNNGGTVETGFTNDGNDIIVAGRTELLHGAYIDGGGGYNVLEVDMKGVYAQPLQLVNIQEVSVQNLPNIYTSENFQVDSEGHLIRRDGSHVDERLDTGAHDNGDISHGIDESDGLQGNLPGSRYFGSTYPFVTGDGPSESILDLSRATSIERLVVTEGVFRGGSNFDSSDAPQLGSLTIVGIRNNATVSVEGGFTEDVYLHYGRGLGDGINLELNLGDTGGNPNPGGTTGLPVNDFTLFVAHNSDTLNILSTGGGNWIANGFLGGELSHLNITGNAELFIEGDLDNSFHDRHPVTIDASLNTAGVNLRLTNSKNVTFLGSSADDKLLVMTPFSFLRDPDDSVTIDAGAGNDIYFVNTVTAHITGENGNSNFEVDAVVSDITAGDGNNHFEVTVLGSIQNLEPATVLVAGDGSNRFDVRGDSEADVSVTAGNGGNIVNVWNGDNISITTGDGDDNITVIDGLTLPGFSNVADAVTIDAGAGNNTIIVEATASIAVTATAGDDVVTLAGMGSVFGLSDAVLLNVDLGAGNNTINLGEDSGLGGVTALPGSTITGENITLVVNKASNLVNAGSLADVDSVVLSVTEANEKTVTSSPGSIIVTEAPAPGFVELTITAEQFIAIGAENFSVEGSQFDSPSNDVDALLKIVVTSDRDLSDLGDLSSLGDGIDFSISIANDATLTLTAEELHNYIADDGIDATIGDAYPGYDEGTFQNGGAVVITNAGLDFDPFTNGQQGGSLLGEGEVPVIGAPGHQTAFSSDDVTVIRVPVSAGGFERPKANDSTDTFTIDSNVNNLIEENYETIHADTLEIIGDQDIEFTGTVSFAGGAQHEHFAADPTNPNGVVTHFDGFTVDFSELNGTATGLTIVDFHLISGADLDSTNDDGEIIGNGVAGTRIDVGVDGQVGGPGNYNGLHSSGVSTYVVTELGFNRPMFDDDSDPSTPEIPDITNDLGHNFYVCDSTEDLEVLGLQGNYDNIINFLQVNWGVEFLLEGDGAVLHGSKSGGNPHYSNVGTFNADFFWEGAPAVVNLNNQGTALTTRALHVEAINIANAESITVNVEDGNAVIGSINNAASANNADPTLDGFFDFAPDSSTGDVVKDLTFVSAFDVTVQGNLDIGDNAMGSLMSLDASAVDGIFTLELTDTATTDLSNAVVTGLEAVVFAADAAGLVITADQLIAVGQANISTINNAAGTLDITEFSTQAIDFTAIDVNIVPNVIEFADIDGTIVVDPGTVFGNALLAVEGLAIPATTNSTSVEMTAAQFNQVAGATPVVTVPLSVGIDAATGDAFVATLVLTDLAANAQIDLGNVDSAQVIRITDVVATGDDPLTAEVEGMVINGDGVTLEVAGGVNDLSLADLDSAGIDSVVFSADGTLTLTALQIADIREENFSNPEGYAVTLNVIDLGGDPIDLNAIQDAGINIGTVALIDGLGELALHADTTLGGADEIITPTADVDDIDNDDGLEDTIFILSAEQFLQTAGIITGDAETHITGLKNNINTDGERTLDAALIDLSGISAPHGTIRLLDENPVTLDAASDLGQFEIILQNSTNDAIPGNSLGAGQTIAFATEVQAHDTVISVDETTSGSDTKVVWLFDTTTMQLETSGYAKELGQLVVGENLVNGENVEELWTFLSGSIDVRIVNDNDFSDILRSFSRTVFVEAFTSTPDGLTFDDQAEFQTISALTIILEGNTNIGNLVIDDTLGEGEFKALTIRSDEAHPDNFDNDGMDVLPNIVGDISLDAGSTNELVDITLNTFSINDGDGDGNGDGTGLALQVGTITFGSEDSSAKLTLLGGNDITIAGVDISSDPEITLLTISMSDGPVPPGQFFDFTEADIVIAGVNQNDLFQEITDGPANLNNIFVVDGYTAVKDSTDLNAAGNNMLQVAGGVNDFTAAGMNVSAINVTADSEITLTAAQIAAIGEENFSNLGGFDVTLNVTEFDGAEAYDLDVIQLAGFDIGTVTLVDIEANDPAISDEITLDAGTTLGGAEKIITPTADSHDDTDGTEETVLTLTAAQFAGLDGAGTIEGEAIVNITGLINDTDNDGVFGPDVTMIDLSGVSRAGWVSLGEPTVTLDATANLTGFDIYLMEDIDGGQMIQFATETQASGATVIEGIPDVDKPDVLGGFNFTTAIAWLFDATTIEIDTSNYDGDINSLFILEDLVDGVNEEALWNTLAESIEVIKTNVEGIPDVLVGIDRINTFEALSAIAGVSYDDQNVFSTVENLTINLEGNTNIGNVGIGDTVGEGDFTSLTINSYEDRTSLGTDDTGFDFQPNIIGDISLNAGTTDDLVNISINTFERGFTGNGYFEPANVTNLGGEREGLEIEVGTITFAAQPPVDPTDPVVDSAQLTLSGAEDITIAAADISDPELNLLTIDATGVDYTQADVVIAGLNQDDTDAEIVADVDFIYVMDGHTSVAGDAYSGTAAVENILIEIVNGTNDLTKAGALGVADVDAVNVSANATITMTAQQISDIGVENFSINSGVVVTLHVTELGGQALDLDVIETAGFSIGTVSTVEDDGAVVNTVLHPDTTLGGAAEFIVLMDDLDNSVTMTAAQYQTIAGNLSELDSDTVTAVNKAAVTITDLVEIGTAIANPNDDDRVSVNINLSNVTTTGIHTLDVADPADPADVTIDATSNLTDFVISLDDIDSDPAIDNELAGQTIRFETALQAERTINVEGFDPDPNPDDRGEADTNVVWNFTTISGTANGTQVDTSRYDFEIGRLWVSDELVKNDNDLEDLFSASDLNSNTLADDLNLNGNIIVRVVNTQNLALAAAQSTGFARTLEVEAFTNLEATGLVFDEADQLVHVESLEIDLGGAVKLGNLVIDNVVAAAAADDTDEFGTLTINSYLATDSTHYLMPENFKDGVNAPPAAANEIGDISAGTGATARGELAAVIVNALDVALDINEIFFADDVANTAVFTVNGDNNVTVKSLDTSDPEITALTVTNNLTAGVLAITGGSPAFDGGNAAGDTETLTIAIGNRPVTTTFGSTDAGTTYAGISGTDLSEVAITGENAGSVVNLGTIARVDSDDFTVTTDDNATFVGTVNLTLGTADANGATAPTLNAAGTWLFDLDSAAAANVTIDGTVNFTPGGTLSIFGATITTTGNVNLSELTLDVTGSTFEVSAGSILTLTAAQAHDVIITGDGTVEILDLEDTPAADLARIMTTAGDTGAVNAHVDTSDDDDADALPEAIELANTLGVAHISVTGDGSVSVAAGVILGYDRDSDVATPLDTISFTVAAAATVNLDAVQVSATSKIVAGGAGTVAVADLSLNSTADLSGLATTTVTAVVANDVTFTGNLGTAVVTVNAGATLTADSAVVSGLTIGGEGTLNINDAVAQAMDLSNVSADFISFDPAAVVGTVTFPVLREADAGATPPVTVQTVTMTAEQADGQAIAGENANAGGVVVVNQLEQGAAAAVDLSNIRAGSLTANVSADAVLDPATDLGEFDIVVEMGHTLTLTGAQVDGLTVTGTGNVVVTDAAAGQDFSGINVGGTFAIVAGDAETELTLSAAQADGASVTGLVLETVTITDLATTPDADLSGIDAANDVFIELASGAAVSIGADADFDTVQANATVQISGNGVVTVDNGATLSNATLEFVENSNASLSISAVQLATTTVVDNSAAGTVAVNVLELEQSLAFDLSAIAADIITATFTDTAGANVTFTGNLGNATTNVATGVTVTVSAAIVDGKTIGGAGAVIVTALNATPAADLSAITTAGGVTANVAANVTFTGDLGIALVTVDDGAVLTVDGAIVNGLTIDQTGTTGAANITNVDANTTLDGTVDFTAAVGAATLTATGVDGDLTVNSTSLFGLAVATGAGANTINTASLADGQTISVTGDDNAIINLLNGDLNATGTGDYVVLAGTGSNIIVTGDGADFIQAGAGADTVDAGAGNDLIVGGADDDILTGGTGADLFAFAFGGDGQDTITDFNVAEDIIDFIGASDVANIPNPGSLSIVSNGTPLFDGLVIIDNNTGTVDDALNLSVAGVAAYLADIDSTTPGPQAITHAAPGVVSYLAVSDGTDTAIFRTAELNANAAINPNELTEIVTLTGIADAGTLTAANFIDFV